jgi:Zn-dependent alcohol dehydrogenase
MASSIYGQGLPGAHHRGGSKQGGGGPQTARRGQVKARAMVTRRFGDPNEFTLEEIDIPDPGPSQLLVRVVASGTNPVDAKLRADGAWARLSPPVVLGYEVSGVVEKIGSCVTDFVPGDEVYYTPEIHGNSRGSCHRCPQTKEPRPLLGGSGSAGRRNSLGRDHAEASSASW